MKKLLVLILTVFVMGCFSMSMAIAEEPVAKSEQVLRLELQVFQSQRQVRLTEISRLKTLKDTIEYKIPVMQAEVSRLNEMIKMKEAQIQELEKPQEKK